VGVSQAIETVRQLVRRGAVANATVLLEGPSGSGKELVARALHDAGPRRHGRSVAVNCGALTESLLESWLFGHRRGAFTSAASDAKGVFQLAHRGTLFLDEIGEASPSFQVHLLRALEEGRIHPVGDGPSVPVDVRMVAATNRDLEREAAQGRFRSQRGVMLDIVTGEPYEKKE
jgi:transcriptional regulator with GAF, ATPase, and Fis domain